jgi:hypothetical protein
MTFKLQLALTMLTMWCSLTDMMFSEAKSKLLIFSRSRSATVASSAFPSFHLCDFTLSVVSEYQYLGIWFHRNLTWARQEHSLLARARRDQYLISRVITTKGGPHFSAIRTLCIGWRPVLLCYWHVAT